MTRDEAEKAIRNGVIAALVVAVLTLLVSVVAISLNSTDETLGNFNDPWIAVDIVLVLILAFFIWRKSRVAAVLMIAYYVIAKLVTMVESGNFSGGIISLIILWFLGRAVWGTFVWHKLDKIDNPIRKTMNKWWLWPIGIGIAIFIGLIGFGLAVTLGSIPAIEVQTGGELPKKQETQLREAGLLESNETVRYYYSTAMFDIDTEGAVLTNKRLLSYWTEEDERDSYSIALEDIQSIKLESEGSYIEDAVYHVFPFDPDPNYMILWLSVEAERHLEMVKAIEAQAAKNAETKVASEPAEE